MPIGTPATVLARLYAAPGTNPTASTETAIMTTPIIGIGQAGQPSPVRIAGIINITAGASTTSITIRIRQGNGIGGTLIVGVTHQLAAGSSASIPFSAQDSSGYLEQTGGGQYTVTVQQNSGTVAGTTNEQEMEVNY